MDASKAIDELADAVKEKLDERDAEKLRDKNKGFVQVYENEMKKFRQIIRKDPVAAEIFYFLLENMDRTNSLACSSRVLEEVTGKSRTTVWKAVKLLKDRKHLEISKMGNCNVYHVNAKVAWKTWGNGRKYAKFNASVIVSQSEQDQDVEVSTTRQASIKKDS